MAFLYLLLPPLYLDVTNLSMIVISHNCTEKHTSLPRAHAHTTTAATHTTTAAQGHTQAATTAVQQLQQQQLVWCVMLLEAC